MVGVMIVPTGLGCSIGGHAGDATPAARLLAEACDTLIVHPNVVNASDINEMTDKMLYVEGSILDGFLEGRCLLRRVRSNRILIAANSPVAPETVNAMNSARVTLGATISILGIDPPLTMKGWFAPGGEATGVVRGVDSLVDQLKGVEYDALALHTPIDVSREVALQYFREGGVNPWGGVEAMASRMIAQLVYKPVAHAPLESANPADEELYFLGLREIVDPRMAPEVISNCYFYCVLKGLHKAPRPAYCPRTDDLRRDDLFARDVDVLISPYGCWGRPHKACAKRGIPILLVRENKTHLGPDYGLGPAEGNATIVENYLEAAGWMLTMRAGVSPASVREGI